MRRGNARGWRGVVLVAGVLLVSSSAAEAADFHHVHVTASNAAEAVRWYTRHLPCEPLSDRGDAVDCGGTEIVFDSQPTRGSSQRTGIDHLAFAYPDLAGKMTELESVGVGGAGVRLQRFPDGSMIRTEDAGVRHAFIFDPWGARIELLEDAERPGFHHVHLSAADPEATRRWYRDHLDGTPESVAGDLAGVRVGSLLLLVGAHEEGVPAPTEGRSIDHLAFEVDSLETVESWRSRGVRFLDAPGVPDGGRTAARRAFVAAPDGVRVALVEPGFAGVDTPPVAAVLGTDTGPYDAPRTPWGEPDLQGVWTGDAAHGTPLERRVEDAGRDELTPEEALARRERGTLGSIWGYEAEWRDTTLGYERSGVSSQVAMVVDPADGRLPAVSAEAERRMTAAAAVREEVPGGPEALSPWVRCITRGPVPMPQVYNNGLQIVQGPGFVAVTREMVHETRVIPTDGRPHIGSGVTSYLGDASGRWEDDSLVVEITNFNGKAPFPSPRVQGLMGSGYGSSETLTLTERYTRTGPDTLRYEFTLDDPSMWTRPWTGMYTFVRDDTQYELVEYACHEGNYGMFNILTGARARDRASEPDDADDPAR